MRLIILFIAILVAFIMAIVMIVSPEAYRNFIRNNPATDPSGKWSDASDLKIRTAAVFSIVILIALCFLILKIMRII